MIDGVVIKKLVTHSDERGFFRELIRATDPFFVSGFGQLSHSLVEPGVIKAWHYHKEQTQWNYPVTGLLEVVLHEGHEVQGDEAVRDEQVILRASVCRESLGAFIDDLLAFIGLEDSPPVFTGII